MTERHTTLQRIALAQDEPAQFLEDLILVKQDHEETPKEMRRFEMKLELDEQDLNRAIEEVAEVVEDD